LKVTVNEMLSPQAQQRAVADFAREQLTEAQDTNTRVLGRRPPHKTFVNGVENAQLETVRIGGGTIVFEFELVADVLRWIAGRLIERSPVLTGAYRRAHTLFADGVEVDVGGTIPVAEDYAFTNTMPYARKIEIGKTRAGRAFVLQVPNQIYERTAKDARARFGNIAKIEFTFRGIAGGRQLAGRAAGRADVRFPTIVVRLT
jgi:hypothetical protein